MQQQPAASFYFTASCIKSMVLHGLRAHEVTARKLAAGRVRRPIIGEEGLAGISHNQLTGTDFLKVFHSNYGLHSDESRNKRYYDVWRHNRFYLSDSVHGFKRLYHLYALAHALHPENTIDVRGVKVPAAFPESRYFDLQNPPLDAKGKVCFPQLVSNRIPVWPTQERRLRTLYKRIRDYRELQFKQFAEHGDKIPPDEVLRRRQKSLRTRVQIENYETWVTEQFRERGISLPELEVQFLETGLMIPHATVNTLLVPEKKGEPARAVACEFMAFIDRPRAKAAIAGLKNKRRRRSAEHHLWELNEEQRLAYADIVTLPKHFESNLLQARALEGLFNATLRIRTGHDPMLD